MPTLFHGVVHPWLCDTMGHLTTRHYMAMFDDASWVLLSMATGWNPQDPEFRGRGWADVRHEIDYLEEVRAGALVAITGCITHIGRTSLKTLYEMRRTTSDTLVARMRARSVFFDLEARRAIPLSNPMRERITAKADALMTASPECVRSV